MTQVGIAFTGHHSGGITDMAEERLALLLLRECLFLYVSPMKGNIMKIENEVRKISALHDVSPKVCTICS